MDYEFEEYEDVIDAETEEEFEQLEVEHDLDYWTEEAESSDAIPEDESISAELEASFVTIIESELDHEEDPVDFDDDIQEDEHDADAPVSFQTLWEDTTLAAVERTSKAARTEADFEIVIQEMDRLDQNRMRKERYHEVLRGDVPLEYDAACDGVVFPLSFSAPKRRLLNRGQFLDVLFDCPCEMHELTANWFLSKSVKELKPEHKELLYYLSLRLYSTVQMAELRGQSDRNIRKVRDTYTRKLQKNLYQHLIKRRDVGRSLSLREKEFILLYEEAMTHPSQTGTKVRRENKSPKRKKATTESVSDGEGKKVSNEEPV